MAKFDFRILLETTEGRKYSYMSSSFVNTDDRLVLSASQVINRISGYSGSSGYGLSEIGTGSLGMISCSYQNKDIFTGDFLPPSSGSRYFWQNTLISASLTGSLHSGSIVFQEP